MLSPRLFAVTRTSSSHAAATQWSVAYSTCKPRRTLKASCIVRQQRRLAGRRVEMLGSYLIHGVDDFVVQPRTLVNDVTVFNGQIQRLYPPVRRWTCGRGRDAVYGYWRLLALCSSRCQTTNLRLTGGILIARRMLLFVTRG